MAMRIVDRDRRPSNNGRIGSTPEGQASNASRQIAFTASVSGHVSSGRGTPSEGRSALDSAAQSMRTNVPVPTTKANWEKRFSSLTLVAPTTVSPGSRIINASAHSRLPSSA